LIDPTGIDALDEILGGGIPRPSANLIIGPKGSGKSVLIKEIAVKMLERGVAVSYYTIDNPASEVKSELQDLGVNTEEYEGRDLLFFVDVFSKAVENIGGSYSNYEPTESVLQSGLQFSDLVDMGRRFTLKNMKRKIDEFVIMDSLTPFFLMSDSKEVYHYCQTLVYATRFANAIGFGIHHTDLLDSKIENALYGLAEGIIKLEKTPSDPFITEPITGTLQVTRRSGPEHLRGPFYYEVVNNHITISTIMGIL